MKDDLKDLFYRYEDIINFSVWCGINYVSYYSKRDNKRIWFDDINLKYFSTEQLLEIWYEQTK